MKFTREFHTTWLRGDQHADPNQNHAGCHGTRAHLPLAIISGVLARVLEPLRNTRGTNKKKEGTQKRLRMLIMTPS